MISKTGDKAAHPSYENRRKGASGKITSLPLSTLNIPFGIKKKLVDECESIQNEGMLLPLPKPIPCSDVIARYIERLTDSTAQRVGLTKRQMTDAARGICEVFDSALGRMLLYKPERVQYAAILETRHGTTKPSRIFGAEHLARLIVKLPQLLADTPEMDVEAIDSTLLTASDLLHFIDENSETMWSTAYVQEDKFREKKEREKDAAADGGEDFDDQEESSS